MLDTNVGIHERQYNVRMKSINIITHCSGVAFVTKTCSRGFCLLIMVCIYQNVHIDKFVSKMHDAIFFKIF